MKMDVSRDDPSSNGGEVSEEVANPGQGGDGSAPKRAARDRKRKRDPTDTSSGNKRQKLSLQEEQDGMEKQEEQDGMEKQDGMEEQGGMAAIQHHTRRTQASAFADAKAPLRRSDRKGKAKVHYE